MGNLVKLVGALIVFDVGSSRHAMRSFDPLSHRRRAIQASAKLAERLDSNWRIFGDFADKIGTSEVGGSAHASCAGLPQ